jgi:hypothetical protein
MKGDIMNTETALKEASVATRPQVNAIAEASVQRELAEVQASIILAKRFPRNQMEALERIKTACQRPALAENALYQYSRGGTDITGPSIRLAEAIAQNWQNLDFGIRELEQRNGESTVEAFCWDKETNTRQVKVFQVPHKRYTKAKGAYSLEDPRDIYETVANQGARRLRACILGIIPGDIVEAAVAECEGTLKAKADCSADAVKKMVEAFGAFKVTREMIEKRIQRHLDSITPAQKVGLGKIYNSLKDGMSSAADWFEVTGETSGETKGSRTDAVKEKVKKSTKEKTFTCPEGNIEVPESQCENECANRKGCPEHED